MDISQDTFIALGPGKSRELDEAVRKVGVTWTVPFHDVDGLNVAWHGHFLKYFELARTEFMRTRGLDNDAWRKANTKLFVVESRCHHSKPLIYGQEFIVRAWLKSVERSRFTVSYDVRDCKEMRRCARGRTLFATTNIKGELSPMPEEIFSKLVRPCDNLQVPR